MLALSHAKQVILDILELHVSTKAFPFTKTFSNCYDKTNNTWLGVNCR